MTSDLIILLFILTFVVALLYSSVGHAGASGYIAVLALFGIAPSIIKPTALLLNIAVASIASWQFIKEKHFSFRLFFPFAVTSVPFAFLGGMIHLPTDIFNIAVGIILLYSALRFFIQPRESDSVTTPSLWVSLPAGALIGLFSGLIGVGGGIFLTPLILFFSWGKTKTAAAVSALFILLNSTAAIIGNVASTENIPVFALPMLIAAVTGGFLGSYFGSSTLAPVVLKRSLAVVLVVAGVKLIAL